MDVNVNVLTTMPHCLVTKVILYVNCHLLEMYVYTAR